MLYTSIELEDSLQALPRLLAPDWSLRWIVLFIILELFRNVPTVLQTDSIVTFLLGLLERLSNSTIRTEDHSYFYATYRIILAYIVHISRLLLLLGGRLLFYCG